MNDVAWAEQSAPPPLDAEVQVWRARVSEVRPLLARLRAALDDDDRAGADRYLAEGDRDRHIVSHGLLRVLLARQLSLDPSALRFANDGRGKPGLAEPSRTDVQFNLSHSGDLVLLALSVERAVGVDVQRWTPLRGDGELERTSERVLSAVERAELGAIPPDSRPEAFFAIWSRKEAYLKGRGEGMSGGLDWFDVRFGDGVDSAASCLVADRRNPDAPHEWTVLGLPVDPAYAAAVAVRAPAPRLRLWTAGVRLLARL